LDLIPKEGDGDRLQNRGHCHFQYQENNNDHNNNIFEIEDDNSESITIVGNHFKISDKIMEIDIDFLLFITIEKEKIEMKDEICYGHKIHEHEKKRKCCYFEYVKLILTIKKKIHMIKKKMHHFVPIVL